MGTDYKITILRKSDNKKIADFWANQIKSILDSKYAETIHCDRYSLNNVKFTVNELTSVNDQAFNDIEKCYDQINEKKMMIALAKSIDIKHALEEDIQYIKEDIELLHCVVNSAYALIGMISCVTEDLVKNGKSAYEYNGKDLPKKKGVYADGTEYESSQCIWNDDVICELKYYY